MSKETTEEYVYVGLETPLDGDAPRQRITKAAQQTYADMIRQDYQRGRKTPADVAREYLGNWITWEQYCAIVPEGEREEGWGA